MTRKSLADINVIEQENSSITELMEMIKEFPSCDKERVKDKTGEVSKIYQAKADDNYKIVNEVLNPLYQTLPALSLISAKAVSFNIVLMPLFITFYSILYLYANSKRNGIFSKENIWPLFTLLLAITLTTLGALTIAGIITVAPYIIVTTGIINIGVFFYSFWRQNQREKEAYNNIGDVIDTCCEKLNNEKDENQKILKDAIIVFTKAQNSHISSFSGLSSKSKALDKIDSIIAEHAQKRDDDFLGNIKTIRNEMAEKISSNSYWSRANSILISLTIISIIIPNPIIIATIIAVTATSIFINIANKIFYYPPQWLATGTAVKTSREVQDKNTKTVMAIDTSNKVPEKEDHLTKKSS